MVGVVCTTGARCWSRDEPGVEPGAGLAHGLEPDGSFNSGWTTP